jgi:hypothetical protein
MALGPKIRGWHDTILYVVQAVKWMRKQKVTAIEPTLDAEKSTLPNCRTACETRYGLQTAAKVGIWTRRVRIRPCGHRQYPRSKNVSRRSTRLFIVGGLD